MKVTLAMGLQYEHSPKHPSSGRDEYSAGLNPSNRIIDVEAIDITPEPRKAMPRSHKPVDYPYYNPQAGLVFIASIGTHLDIII